MSVKTNLTLYQELLNEVWRRMVGLVGIHTVVVLVQRAVWLTREKYAQAEGIYCDEQGIILKNLANLEPLKFKLIVEEFIGSLVNILTRLVGEDIADKLTAEFAADMESGHRKVC